MTARFGKGAEFGYETTPGGGTYQVVPGMRNISGPSREISEVDVTSHDTAGNFSEFISGLQDPGEFSGDLLFDPDDATHQQLITDMNAGTERNWRVRWDIGGGDWFHMKADGFIKSFPIETPTDNALSARLVVRLKGAITFVDEP